jgi:hypothetical protein
LQILLQMEDYLAANTVPGGRVRLDEDFVWDVANSIRWLSQTFKEKFKIEKFLFGELYAAYNGQAGEIISSLMEELGYDIESHAGAPTNAPDEATTTTNSTAASPASSKTISPAKIASQTTTTTVRSPVLDTVDSGKSALSNFAMLKTCLTTTTTSVPFVNNQPPAATGDDETDSNLKTPVKKTSLELSYFREDSCTNSTTTTSCSFSYIGRVNSLFEDCCSQSNDVESIDRLDEYYSSTATTGPLSSQNTADERRNSLELLNEFKKKKL